MTAIKVSVPPFPQISMKESDNFTALCQSNIPQIRQLWGSFINAACAAYGTDINMMIGFIAIECPDLNPSAHSGAGAIGVMQLQPATAWDYLNKQVAQLPAPYATVIQRVLPGLLKPGGFTGLYSTWKAQFTQALFDPEFNIWTAVTGLSQLIWADIKANNGNLRLDHVIVKYNAGGTDWAGAYHKYVVSPGFAAASPQDLINNSALPTETKAYLIKYLGIDGAVVTALRTA